MAILTDEDITKFDTGNSPSASKVLTDADVAKFDSHPKDEHSQSLKEMARGAFQSAGDLVKAGSQSVAKIATGKSFADRVDHEIPANTERPFDANVQAATKNYGQQVAKDTIAQTADQIINPINIALSGSSAVASGVKKIGQWGNDVKNTIAKEALSPEFAQSKQDFNYGHDARRVMTTMPDVVGEDINSTQAAISNKMNETGQAIQDTMANHPQASTKLDIEDAVTQPFDKRIAELNQQNPKLNAPAIKRLQVAKNGLINITDESGKTTGTANLNEMTPKEAWDYRKGKIDPMTKFTGRVSDDAVVNSAYQEARGNIRNTINSVMPELKPLNKDYGDLSAADEAIDRMMFKNQKEGLPSLDLKDILSLGITKWVNNPVNRMKLAQFLYSSPKQEIEQLGNRIPSFNETVQEMFKEESKPLGDNPDLSSMTPSRFESTSPVPENFDPSAKGKADFQKYAQENPQLADKWKNFGKGTGALALTGGLVSSGNANAAQPVNMNKIYKIESSGNPNAYNAKTQARGLGQITPIVLKEWNANHPEETYTVKKLFNAETNKKISDWYMNEKIPTYLRAYKIPDTTENRLVAYNAGIKTLKDKLPLKPETISYIRKFKRSA